MQYIIYTYFLVTVPVDSVPVTVLSVFFQTTKLLWSSYRCASGKIEGKKNLKNVCTAGLLTSTILIVDPDRPFPRPLQIRMYWCSAIIAYRIIDHLLVRSHVRARVHVLVHIHAHIRVRVHVCIRAHVSSVTVAVSMPLSVHVRVSVFRQQETWTFSVDMDMYHRHGHAG